MKDRKQWGFGRIEYLACMEDIRKQLDQHMTLRAVYDELAESGKITVGYPQFCKFATGKARLPAVRAPRKKTSEYFSLGKSFVAIINIKIVKVINVNIFNI